MDRGRHTFWKLNSYRRRGTCISRRMYKPRIACRLLMEAQKRKNALAIFSRLFGDHLVKSTLFNMAESIVKRIKTHFLVGWAQRYLPKTKYFLATKSVHESEDNESITSNVAGNKCHTFQGRAHEARTDSPVNFAEENCNLNAKSSADSATLNKHGNKRSRNRTKRRAARSVGCPRRAQLNDSKLILPCRPSQRSKRCVFIRKRCPRVNRQDDKIPVSAKGVAHMQLIETLNTNASQNKICDIVQANDTACLQNDERPTTEHTHSTRFKQPGTVLCTENKGETVTQKRAGKRRRAREKTKALLNLFVVGQNKVIDFESKENKQSHPRQKLTQIRRKCERTNIVASSQLNTGPSNFSFKSTLTDINDWPSLTEVERPKGLMKEAAKEIVRSKQARSVAKNARKLLADIATLKTCDLDTSRQASGAFGLTIQQPPDTLKSTTKQRTWASVAAQSLTGRERLEFEHAVSPTCLPDSKKNTENSRRYKSPSGESVKTCKVQLGSKLDSTNRMLADRCKVKEKSNSRKHLIETDERAKLRQTVRCRRNRRKQRCGQTDQVQLLSPSLRNRKLKRTEKSEGKQDKMKTNPSVLKTKCCIQQKWKVDKMPVVLTQSGGHVLNLSKELMSETSITAGSEGSARMTRSRSHNNMSAPERNMSVNVQINSSHSIHHPIAESPIFSNQLVDMSDSCSDETTNRNFIKASQNFSNSKDQSTFPGEDNSNNQKKVSVRYRALLRVDVSRLGTRTVSQIEPVSTMTVNLRQDKMAARTKQREQQHERQRTQNNCQLSPALVQTAKSTENSPALYVESSFPYWLRLRCSKSGLVRRAAPSNTQLNTTEAKDLVTKNMATTVQTNSTPCRRSERLCTKNVRRSTSPASAAEACR